MLWRREEVQQRADRDRALDLGLAHHDDDVGDQHRLLRLVQQLDRAGAIEDRPRVAEEGRVGDVDLGRHAAGPRLGGVIADRIAVAHAAAPAGRAAGEQQRFEQCRLARQIRADQGDTAGGARHRDPPLQSGRGRHAARAALLFHGHGSWRAAPSEAIGIWRCPATAARGRRARCGRRLRAVRRSRSRRRCGNAAPGRRPRHARPRRPRPRADSARKLRHSRSSCPWGALADEAGAGRVDVEGAFRPRAIEARHLVQRVDDEVAALLEEEVVLGDEVLRAVQRLDRRGLADRARVGGRVRLDRAHRLDQLARAAGIADAPAGHAIGLRDAVDGQGALIEPRLDLGDRPIAEIVVDDSARTCRRS